MSNESPLPAALPALLYATGLFLSDWLIDPCESAAALLAGSLLLFVALRSERRIRWTLLVMSLAGGLWTGGVSKERLEHERLELDRADSSRFVDVEARLRNGWRPGEAGEQRLRSDQFTVNGSLLIKSGVTIYTYVEPPLPSPSSAMIRVRGHLRRGESGAYSVHVKSARLISYAGTTSRWDPRQWNRMICARLDQFSARHPHVARGVALVQALALGRSDQLPAEVKVSYQRAGTYHLLVFSGMQIALAAAAFSRALSFLRSPRLTDWILLLLGIAAPVFAGHEASVERCSWMIGLYALSRICHRPTSSANLLFVSALLRLIVHPEELADAGFALTYAATAGLIFIGGPLALNCRNRLLRLVAFGAGAEVATIPLTLYFFHHAVVGSSLLTIVLAPVFTLMLALSALACALLVTVPAALIPVLEIIQWLDALCRHLNATISLMGLSRSLPAPPLMILQAAFVLSLLAVVHLRRLKAMGSVIILLTVPIASVAKSILLASVEVPQVEFLDVGQGDAILIRTGRHAILVDGGNNRVSFARSGLVPDLLGRGVTQLDAIVLTHPHPDHCGGLPEVLERLHVKELWISGRHLSSPCGASLIETAWRKSVVVRLAEKLPRLQLDPRPPPARRETMSGQRGEAYGATIETLVPAGRFRRASENNSSVVLRFRAAGRSLLLTGDMEKDGERALLSRENEDLRSDVLKVAHHGSGSSTTEALLDAVAPRLAVISCGRGNRFGHPQAQVVSRLRSRGVRLYRTDRNGAVRVRFSNPGLFVTVEIDTPRVGT
ncbi:MAG TPA: DNA internalization-related competence protein ComEC/Rec2 [Thermoanaerobaculia bacterium]|nr:DNA internalization-related competence protein ComEC/Rec2 [Thermoanaerobaculia bacterium]